MIGRALGDGMTSLTKLTIVAGLTAVTAAAALAQDAAAPSAAAPPAATPPAATATPPAAAPAAAEAAPAAATDEAATPGTDQLPEVKVIQKEEPKPQVKPKAPPKKVVTAAPGPKPAPAPTPAAAPQPEPVAAPSGTPPAETAIKMSPIGGSEIPLDKVPSGVSVVTASEINRDASKQVQNALQQNVPGVILTDTAGSAFRTDVQYRGFDASPIGGRSQAIAVYQQGIRINESFGDTVNLDAIPNNAIDDIAIVSNNPAFGLNAVGGAISIAMKDGFLYQGSEIDIMGGSYGRRQIAVQTGGNSGSVGAYVAAEAVHDSGFRDFSEADVRRMYADLGFKGSAVELHFNFTGADSTAGVVTAAPEDLLNNDWGRTFTSPQDTEYQVLMPSINAKVKATDTLTLSALAYYRSFKQNVLDGNIAAVEPCTTDPTLLCSFEDGEEPLLDANGKPIPVPGDAVGTLDRITQDAESEGVTLQAVEKAKLLGHENQFLVGASYDHGKVAYQTSSEIGSIGPRFVVTGTGNIAVEPDDFTPRNLTTENTYYGLYFSDTFNVTEALAITAGGRYNYAEIQLTDLTGDFPEINSLSTYERFNPMAGATYRLLPGISVYGGYSESNRAPTAAELSCANPANPCLIESFLTDDPPLNQVVGKTWEAGLRGEHKSYDSQRLTWSLGYFHTLNEDDILNVAATSTGRGYFLNAGNTLRQGVEAAVGYESSKWSGYASYAFIDATYQSNLILPAPNTPEGTIDCPGATGSDPAQCNVVSAGDHLTGIPQHRFKAGFNYWLTDKWQAGADLIATTDQYFFGDEANNNRQLQGYTRVDLHTTYDVNENVQIYGLVKNLFDQRYGLYGTFFDPEEVKDAADAAGVTLANPRSITPASPISAYGGLRLKF